MTDTSQAAAPEATATTSDASPTGTKPTEEPTTFDADYVKGLRAEAAKYRTEAKTNAEAARRLAELEESQKTEAQKIAERLAVAEEATSKAQAEALRYRIATKHRISDEDAETFLTGTDEESITRQAERLVALQQPGTPRPDPSQGARAEPAVGDMNAIIRGSLRR